VLIAKAFLMNVRNLFVNICHRERPLPRHKYFTHRHRQALSLITVVNARPWHKRHAGILNGLVFCYRKIMKMCHIQFENPWHSDTPEF
jgi:hypothetical protein